MPLEGDAAETRAPLEGAAAWARGAPVGPMLPELEVAAGAFAQWIDLLGSWCLELGSGL